MVINLSEKMNQNTRVLYIEPYYGGSHRLLLENLRSKFPGDLFTMRPKKWGWRLRSAALTLSQKIPPAQQYDILFASSMLNLAEFLSLRPDFTSKRKVLYCHENQLEYPKQNTDQEERDYYFGHANVVSCLVADIIVWNSNFNLESFLKGVIHLFASLPIESDCKPKSQLLINEIRRKSIVIPIPIDIPELPVYPDINSNKEILRIGYPHRWEHDKNPDLFLRVLYRLKTEAQVNFTVMIFGGETFELSDVKSQLLNVVNETQIASCGHISDRIQYLKFLQSCDVVVSTAVHEFFGVAMVEAALLGCHVICPKRLSYPELFQNECMYTTDAQLFKMLKYLCERPQLVKRMKPYSDLRDSVRETLQRGYNNFETLFE